MVADQGAPDHQDCQDYEVKDPDPDEVHQSSWSVNLETPEFADEPAKVQAEALQAIALTAEGYHVNLVTHGDNGHPETYLFETLNNLAVDFEYIEQCSCGGHVTRVYIE